MEGFTSYVRREPIGVVGQVTPVELPADDGGLEDRVLPSRRATPSSSSRADTTPVSTALLAEIAQEALPPGVLNVVCGDRDTGRALVEHPAPGLVSITGSTRAGIEVARSAAADVKRTHSSRGARRRPWCSLDADFDEAAEGIGIGGVLQCRPGLHRGLPGAGRGNPPTTRRGRKLVGWVARQRRRACRTTTTHCSVR